MRLEVEIQCNGKKLDDRSSRYPMQEVYEYTYLIQDLMDADKRQAMTTRYLPVIGLTKYPAGPKVWVAEFHGRNIASVMQTYLIGRTDLLP